METVQQLVSVTERSGILFGSVAAAAPQRPKARLPLATSVIEHARIQLLAAIEGSARAAARLYAVKPALAAAAGNGNAQACEILSAMCAAGLGVRRNREEAREWLVRAVHLLEDDVEPPMPGTHGFVLLPTDRADAAYRPLYTAHGALVTNEIGVARAVDGAICFDRRDHPVLQRADEIGCAAIRATPRLVAARIARDSTLEDFAWACGHTSAQFRQKLIDARVIARGRMGSERGKKGAPPIAAASGIAPQARFE